METRRPFEFKRAMILLGTAILAIGLAAPPAHAGTILDDWASVKAPPAPAVKAVTVDPGTTALLVLDLLHQNCNDKRRPLCVASLPVMKKLVDEARAHHLLIVYSTFGKHTPKDIWTEVAPTDHEPWVQTSVDKFYNTDLEKILKDKGIKTVIAVGTAAQGALLYTASEAALRGFKVIIPVEGVTAEDTYFEQYTVYQLLHAPTISHHVTLTKVDMITF